MFTLDTRVVTLDTGVLVLVYYKEGVFALEKGGFVIQMFVVLLLVLVLVLLQRRRQLLLQLQLQLLLLLLPLLRLLLLLLLFVFGTYCARSARWCVSLQMKVLAGRAGATETCTRKRRTRQGRG